ncbi:DNA-binding Lrp family transcriptional regulator [Sporosarcina luteola]|nr:DNA-binding Lrp family transcriptional regulator [Sporosarcina luteola]
MDTIDQQLILALQEDCKTSMTNLGKRIALSQPAVTERVKKLEEKGLITGYKAIVNRKKVNKPVSAFLLFQARHCDEFVGYSKTIEDVLEIHRISGQYNFLVKVIATTLEALESTINDLGRFGDSTTLVVLSTPMENRPIIPFIPTE